ncbi:MAG: AAA family ATPase [Thermovenabulum sp.]|uniref:ATP-binding protein n=1 Tax=Thermovenabulum sp. TaxID=3100335 RepID=UPI003C7A945A
MNKKLPIGIQSFKVIREEPYYYVDKTFFVKKLVDNGKYYFLSRPRRFGKSLFVDTLRWAFLGKREYFEGLYLENNWDWDKKYPVISISFGSSGVSNVEDLKVMEKEIILRNCREYGIELEFESVTGKFFELIQKLYEKYNAQVVILIDEYDKPILDRIEEKESALAIREELKSFYSVIKDADQYIKFVFITGVSKFSKLSLFSGLNNLQDITLNPEYAVICGYTQQEFEKVFSDRLQGVNLKKVREWYNGYKWLGESVYNPFDVLLYLSEKNFRPFWFETGTPTFLIKLMIGNKYYIPSMEDLEAGEELIGSFDVEQIYAENLLFQAGYLTIKEKLGNEGLIRYRLGFPNLEVRYSLTNHLLNYLVEDYRKKEINRTALFKSVLENDFEKMKEVFYSFFASIPAEWYRKNDISGSKGYYASIFYCYFSSLGFKVIAEDATNYGKIDMSVIINKKVYIFEFKVLEYIPQGSALSQLKQKRYFEKYLAEYEEIYLIGVEFSKDERNIVSFNVEKIK